MRFSEIVRLVWLNLSQNKFKVVMSSIGIVAGSATIMMVLAIGTGGREKVAEQFKNLNAGAIDISCEGGNSTGFKMRDAGSSKTSGTGRSNSGGMPAGGGAPSGSAGMPAGGGAPSGSSSGMPNMGGAMPFFGGNFPGFMFGRKTQVNEEITLTYEDAEELLTFVPGVAEATISYSTTSPVEGGDLESESYYTVAGVLHNYAEISNLTMAIGEFLTEENDQNKEKVCILGATAAASIFGSAYAAYDSALYIDGRAYVVAGVLSEMGSMASGISPDSAIFIPYQTGIKYITGESISPTVTVIAEDISMVDTIMSNAETVLKESYPNTAFTISDAGSKMDAASASNETLTMLLVSMAAIVFLVGGIGIMNVLFVTVKERTNEIGILKAIGASRGGILLEFLLEASCTSLVGGVIGVLLALGITPLVEYWNIRVSLSVQGAALALAFGVATGSVFGFYPAFKASRLIPVVALNKE